MMITASLMTRVEAVTTELNADEKPYNVCVCVCVGGGGILCVEQGYGKQETTTSKSANKVIFFFIPSPFNLPCWY